MKNFGAKGASDAAKQVDWHHSALLPPITINTMKIFALATLVLAAAVPAFAHVGYDAWEDIFDGVNEVR